MIKKKEKPKRKVVLRQSPLERMQRLGRLNVWEFTAADDLTRAFRSSMGVGSSRDPLLGVSNNPRPDSADAAIVGRIDAVEHYRKWRRNLEGSQQLAVAVAILFDENSLRDTERSLHLRNGQASKLLISALRDFAALRGNTPRGARDWKIKRPAIIETRKKKCG